MPPAKKLQVFVSSTYTDLRAERQAAVEAILSSGHIPAGMELFAAGDESQMDVIRRWIDESDVFLLILGGRYGSLEPKSGKSYIHLEYEYATEKGKPLFAVVLEDAALDKRVKKVGKTAIETENSAKFRDFREVVLSKIVRMWSDVKDIKLAILETLNEYARRTDLIGWIPGDQAVNTRVLAEEIARLIKENAELRAKVADSAQPSMTYLGLSFDHAMALLQNEAISLSDTTGIGKYIGEIAAEFGDPAPTLLHLLWSFQKPGLEFITTGDLEFEYVRKLALWGLLDLTHSSTIVSSGRSDIEYRVHYTDDAKKLILRLTANMITSKTLVSGSQKDL